jgi:hypothetical protein
MAPTVRSGTRRPSTSRGVLVAMLDVVKAVAVRVVRASHGGVQHLDVIGRHARQQPSGRARLVCAEAEDFAQPRRPVHVLGRRIFQVVVLEDAELRAAHGLVEAGLGVPQLVLRALEGGDIEHRAKRDERTALAVDGLEMRLRAHVQEELPIAGEHAMDQIDAAVARGISRGSEGGLCARPILTVQARPRHLAARELCRSAVKLEEPRTAADAPVDVVPLEPTDAPCFQGCLQGGDGALGSAHHSSG